MVLAIAVTSALVIGFLAGLLTFKKSQQWCEVHGATKVCPECTALIKRLNINAGRWQ